MIKKAEKLMKQREVMIAEAMEVLSILGADLNTEVVEKIIEVEKEDNEKVKELEKEIERLNAIIAEKDKTIEALTKRNAIKPIVEETEEIKKKVKEEIDAERQTLIEAEKAKTQNKVVLPNSLQIMSQDENAVNGYHIDENGVKTPFTCGRKVSMPIVYGKGKMVLSDTIGRMLVEQGLVKNNIVDIDIKTMSVQHKGKDLEMLVYRDQTGALVGALEQRCAFVRSKDCKLPLVTQMKAFIKTGHHLITDENGDTSQVIGYKDLENHKAYVHTIAAALVKFEEEEALSLSKLQETVSNDSSSSIDDMFESEFGFSKPVEEPKENAKTKATNVTDKSSRTGNTPHLQLSREIFGI